MLIKCPECGKEISDKTDKCIHCGYPIRVQKAQKASLSHMPCPKCGSNWHTFKDEEDVCKVCGHIFCEEEINQYNIQVTQYKQATQASKIRCPYCKSTNVKKIGTGGRLLSTATFGIAGSKIGKQWHCNNCKSDF